MGDYIAYERGMKEGDMHPVITAMNTLGFEASTLGNHEFNYGLDFLMKSLAGANFPVVSANVAKEMGASPTADTTLVKPYVILEKMVKDGVGADHNQNRLDRFRAATDHELGCSPSRRQGQNPRHRRDGKGLGADR